MSAQNGSLTRPRSLDAVIAFAGTRWHVVRGKGNAELKMKACTLEDARAAKAEATGLFGSLASVIGVGITRIGDGYGLKINLQEEAKADLPTEVAGVPVEVEVIGPIRKR